MKNSRLFLIVLVLVLLGSMLVGCDDDNTEVEATAEPAAEVVTGVEDADEMIEDVREVGSNIGKTLDCLNAIDNPECGIGCIIKACSDD